MNTHAKKEKKQQISTKKAKQRQNISTKKNLLNLIPIHSSNPLSSPYSDLIEIFLNCYPVGCFKTTTKEKQNPIQT